MSVITITNLYRAIFAYTTGSCLSFLLFQMSTFPLRVTDRITDLSELITGIVSLQTVLFFKQTN